MNFCHTCLNLFCSSDTCFWESSSSSLRRATNESCNHQILFVANKRSIPKTAEQTRNRPSSSSATQLIHKTLPSIKKTFLLIHGMLIFGIKLVYKGSNSHRKEITKLTFRGLALRQSERRKANAWNFIFVTYSERDDEGPTRKVSFVIASRWKLDPYEVVWYQNFSVALPQRRSATVSFRKSHLWLLSDLGAN